MHASRGSRFLAAALVIAAFGPYVASGIRTEQLLVYAVAPFAALSLVGAKGLPRTLGSVAAVWAVYASIGAVGGLTPPYNSTPFKFGSLGAGLDNLALPLAVLVIGCALSYRGDASKLARTVSWWVIALMIFNTVAATLQSQGLGDWSAWWGTDATGFSVAGNAEGNSRYSGLINQPAEAGLLYGIAMLAALYLWSASRPIILVATLSVLAYGGVMTVSKVFLLVALPIVLWQLVTLRGGRVGRLLGAAFGLVGVYVILQSGWLPEWTGGDQLAQVLPGSDQSFVSSVTASRFGEESTLEAVISAVIASSPAFGFGAVGLVTPYDNGFVEALVVAGLVGVVCYGLTLWLWASAWPGSPKSLARTFLSGLVILATGASMGLPALTANRGATPLWLLLTFLAVIMAREKNPPSKKDPEVVVDPPGARRPRSLA